MDRRSNSSGMLHDRTGGARGERARTDPGGPDSLRRWDMRAAACAEEVTTMANRKRCPSVTVLSGNDKLDVLKRVLKAERFWEVLEASVQPGNTPGSVPILIKPDFAYFDFKGPTGTDPELVEHLVD